MRSVDGVTVTERSAAPPGAATNVAARRAMTAPAAIDRSPRTLPTPRPGPRPGQLVGSLGAGRLGVDEAVVEEVVVRGEIQEAVAGVVEQDHPLLAGLLARERLVDRGADRVAGLGRRDLPFGVREGHRRLERLALR